MLVVTNIRCLQATFHPILTDSPPTSSCFAERLPRCSLAADSATSVEHNVALVVINNTAWNRGLGVSPRTSVWLYMLQQTPPDECQTWQSSAKRFQRKLAVDCSFFKSLKVIIRLLAFISQELEHKAGIISFFLLCKRLMCVRIRVIIVK